ncbi:probable calcium-binding protein CML36 [Glycine soja]|uniref:Putative calcium-binding protein CML36 n=1 Tax=Glycine soja TaxID=3848 RepID=A0A445FFW9_GLYSO|nr:probable calcium-binding protein CML36 [Glycine soja]RZB47762.1 putative calcium-binding protein CML36 [Glycine soja]
MKLISSINPKNLKLSPKRFFRKKERSLVSRSDPPSFGSGSSSDDSTTNHKPSAGNQTPTSVLPGVSGDWSDVAAVDVRWDLAQAFRLIDRDNDGVVTRQDLEALLTCLGASPCPDDVAIMLGEVDGDGITVERLMSYVGSGLKPGSDPDELKEAFEVFDTDRDGRISAEELLRVFKAIGDERCTLEECRRMIEGVDRNGDGFVCFEDFSRMMELQQQR